MKDANDTTLKAIVNNVQETVDFLEKFSQFSGSHEIFKPTSSCFKDINTETGVYELAWESAQMIRFDLIKSIVSFLVDSL
jgi:hypothetical protein